MEPGQAAPAAGGYGELVVTALLVLAAVCVVVVVLGRYGRRWLGGGRGDEGLVRVRARVPLEPRRALYLIEVGGQTLLLGSGEGGIHVLTELEAGTVPPEEERGGWVSHALGQRGWPARRREADSGAWVAQRREAAAGGRRADDDDDDDEKLS